MTCKTYFQQNWFKKKVSLNAIESEEIDNFLFGFGKPLYRLPFQFKIIFGIYCFTSSSH